MKIGPLAPPFKIQAISDAQNIDSYGKKLFMIDFRLPNVANNLPIYPYRFILNPILVLLNKFRQPNKSENQKKTGKNDNPQAQQMQMIGKVMPVFFGFISWIICSACVRFICE